MKLNTLLVIIIVGSLVLFACAATPAPVAAHASDYEDPTSAPVVAATSIPFVIPPTSASAGKEAKVKISGSAFSPSKLEIRVGTTVTWKNSSNLEHTVEADDGSFNSNPLNQGDIFSFTFKTAGSYSYHCGIHNNMKGTIIVTP